MQIYENGENALTRYRGGKVVKTDHNMMKCEINLSFHIEKNHNKVEMFNLTNKDCQIKFRNYTTNTNTFSKCFETKEGIETQFNRWKRKLVKALHASFKKIRITENSKKKESVIDVFINEKNAILKKKVKEREDLTKIEELDKIIGDECEDREILKLQKVLGSWIWKMDL